ncbi:MAG TPA: aminoacyl-tRNA hydrolase [Chthoniobacterales bacterium]|jgi:PTH1 family peptidyl-tRNA hydrolase
MSEPLPVRLIIGLGNPGRQYAGTRHNVGFEVLDRLVGRKNLRWQGHRQFQGELASEARVIYLKPQTYMNLSGQSASQVARFYKLEPAQCLVVVDDIALDLGRLRMRKSGSAGGHNGLKSLIAHFQTDAFPRLRIGVGEVSAGRDLSDHVLSPFSKSDREKIEPVLDRAAEAVEYACSSGVEPAMNLYNQTPNL